MLTYTAGHINYGGRVTDDWDRRCLLCLLADYYATSVLNERCVFDESGAYRQVVTVICCILCFLGKHISIYFFYFSLFWSENKKNGKMY